MRSNPRLHKENDFTVPQFVEQDGVLLDTTRCLSVFTDGDERIQCPNPPAAALTLARYNPVDGSLIPMLDEGKMSGLTACVHCLHESVHLLKDRFPEWDVIFTPLSLAPHVVA